MIKNPPWLTAMATLRRSTLRIPFLLGHAMGTRCIQRQLDLVDYPSWQKSPGRSGSQVTSSDIKWPWSRICEHGAKKKNSRLAPCRQVGDTPSLRRKMMVKQEMVVDSSSRQAAILGDKVVCFSYGFPIVFLCFSQLSYGFPMCIFIYTFISCLTTLHPY